MPQCRSNALDNGHHGDYVVVMSRSSARGESGSYVTAVVGLGASLVTFDQQTGNRETGVRYTVTIVRSRCLDADQMRLAM